MPSFTINIPIRNIDALDVKEAFASLYGYSNQILVGGVYVANPISKEEFVKQKCVNYILDIVKTELIKNEEVTAKQIVEQIVADRTTDVTQWFDNRRLEAIGGNEIYQQFPQVNSINISTFKNKPVDFTLTATEPNNLPVTFYFTTNPNNGIITGVSPNFTYTPTNNFVGNDLIKFKASNGTKNSLEATVDIIIDNKLTIQNQNILTRKNQNVEISLSAIHNIGNVNYEIVDNPNYGQIIGDNPFIYSPQNDFLGSDLITIKAQDDINESDVAIIDIYIVDLISESYNSTIYTNLITPLNLIAQNAVDNLTFNIISQPQNGSLVVDSNNSQVVNYISNLDYTGIDSFTYQAIDNLGQSNIATITLEIISTN